MRLLIVLLLSLGMTAEWGSSISVRTPNDEKKELLSVIDSGWFTEAKKTQEYEKLLCDFTKSKFACAVTSGTTG